MGQVTLTVAEAYQNKPDAELNTLTQRVTGIERQNENWYRIFTIKHPYGFSVDKHFLLYSEDATVVISRRCVVCNAPLGDMVPRQQKRCYAHQRFHRRAR